MREPIGNHTRNMPQISERVRPESIANGENGSLIVKLEKSKSQSEGIPLWAQEHVFV